MIWDDKPHEECGVFGIYAPDEDVARLTFFGLYALQHRGQESAGIATSNGEHLSIRTRVGLVNQAFAEEDLKLLPGYIAVGHARYSTQGSSNARNAGPMVAQSPIGPIAAAFLNCRQKWQVPVRPSSDPLPGRESHDLYNGSINIPLYGSILC